MAILFWIVINLVIICLSVPSVRSVNYCSGRMCQHPNSHTLCIYTPGPGPGCTGFMDAALSPEEKARILARMNRRRSDAAAGLLQNLPPAADMLKLRWVEELAREAQLWADQCSPIQIPEENDECRDLYSTTVGQCIASVVGEAPGLKAASMVDVWYLQSLKFKWNATLEPPPVNRVEYADFMQMLWAKVYMVGCARARFMSPWRGHLRSVERLVCNFAPSGPPPGATLWTPGSPASACPPHSSYDRDLPSLCSYHSSFVNSPYTLRNNGLIKEEEILLRTLLEIEQNYTLNYMGSLDQIYLTKLAIATISPTDKVPPSTPLYSSLRKRDVQDLIDVSHNVIDVDFNQTNEDFNVFERDPSTPGFDKNISAINIVGRPKTYDIDELSDVVDEKITENSRRTRRREEKHKVDVDKELYMDYENDISRTDPESIADITHSKIGDVEKSSDESIIQDVDRFYDPKTQTVIADTEKAVEYRSTSYPQMNNYSDMQYFDVTQARYVVTINEPTHKHDIMSGVLSKPLNKTEEEYLSDPETAREIQAALERMENDRSQTMTLPPLSELPLVLQGKVRRDLRDIVPRSLEGNVETGDPTNTYDDRIPGSTSELLKKKNITDEGPIYRMMQHYVPYFNKYKDFVGDSNSSGYSGSSARLTLLAVLALTI